MTNKKITAKIESAGLNRAKLEALAAEKGAVLSEDAPEDGSVTSAAPVEDRYDQNRLITPVMAVCAISGDAAAVPENGQAGKVG